MIMTKFEEFKKGATQNADGSTKLNVASAKMYGEWKTKIGDPTNRPKVQEFLKGITRHADGTITISAASTTMLKQFIQNRRANK